MTPDKFQAFGVLSENPSNEVRYAETNSNSRNPVAAKTDFLQNPALARVFNDATAGATVSREFSKAATVLQQIRGLADLTRMDFVF